REPGSSTTPPQPTILTKLTGETLVDYLRPRLFAPLGIENPTWDTDPQGRSLGGSGLHITTEDIARFGQMYLQKGEWNGQRILTEAWIDEATTAHSDNSNTQTNPDWTAGYGYQFWRCRFGGAYRGDGAFGQFCIVFPEHDAVLAMTSGVQNLQLVLDRVWEHLLPAFGDTTLPEDPAAQKALTSRLSSLTLPVAEGASASGIAAAVSGTTYEIEPNEFSIERVRFSFDEDSTTVTFTNGLGEQPVSAGYGVWREGTSESRVLGREYPWSSGLGKERMAACGIWIADDTFELRICYTESEVCPILRFHFSAKQIAIEVEPNVSWEEPTRTILTGRGES
ncbi:MAG: serine hydrolase, partial [Thermomicrobiales bacterium]|nr:serine hydrolase [Thermomicrobiales bacterium]